MFHFMKSIIRNVLAPSESQQLLKSPLSWPYVDVDKQRGCSQFHDLSPFVFFYLCH